MNETEYFIVCNRSTYRNGSISEYSNTYYKAYFSSSGATTDGGIIATIHSNETLQNVDANLESILLGAPGSTFTGRVVLNYLNDMFAMGTDFSKGLKEKEYILSLTDENGESAATNASGNGCTAYYLVTTSSYFDLTTGLFIRSEQDWEVLFVTCNDCNPIGQPGNIFDDCDLGGSGGTGGPETGETETIEIKENHVSLESNCNYTINYSFTEERTSKGKLLSIKKIHNAHPDYPHQNCTLTDGRDVLLKTELYSHYNFPTPKTFGRWMITWTAGRVCRYIFDNGDPEHSPIDNINYSYVVI